MVAISLCMIVKNEEAHLAECLSGIAGAVDEIIIVDTGSTDRTREIALRYTDQVYDFAWRNDFAAARQFSISKAKYEYILMLDSDEIVESIEIQKIKRLMIQNPQKIGRLLRINEFTRNGAFYQYVERVNRLFSKKYYRYEGIIHEQLVPVTTVEIETYPIPLRIRHSGYEGDLDTRRKKTERNITLLTNALEENPEDPYLQYQLGKSFYMQEDYRAACEWFGKALSYDLDPRLEYVQDLVESYGYTLLNTKQYDTAMQLLNVYDEFAVNADFVFLAGLIYMNNGRFVEAIKEFQKAAGMKEYKVEGVNSYRAYYNIGVIHECLGNKEKARQYYLQCGEYPPAMERLSAETG